MEITESAALRRRITLIGTASTLMLGLTLAGCSASDSATTPLASSNPTTAGGDVVELAEAFSATLSDDQLELLNQDYSLTNAANWSNFPNALLSGGGGGAPSGGGAAPSGGTETAPSGAPDGGGSPPRLTAPVTTPAPRHPAARVPVGFRQARDESVCRPTRCPTSSGQP